MNNRSVSTYQATLFKLDFQGVAWKCFNIYFIALMQKKKTKNKQQR